MTYSLDFRQRVLHIKSERSLTDLELSAMFNVSTRSIIRWKVKIEPLTTRNKPATKIDMDKLKKNIEDNPDLYQYERANIFKVSKSAIGTAMQRLGITYKKNSKSSKGKS